MSQSLQFQPSLLAAAIGEYDALVTVARRKVRCHALAADVVQDVMVKLVQGNGGASPPDDSQAFLRVVTRNLAVSALRRQARERHVLIVGGELKEEVADPAPGAERIVIARGELREMARAVEGLPPRCRDVFVLHKFAGLPYSEVAARLGIAPNTVMVHMANALKQLKRCRDALGPG